ncbi:MAG TPA: XylR N-terminal domain-containing protein [Chloroflexia bacterium]|nr:XylR N-terminal domain-containing protein [Chloroflexia bacterium]
MKAQDLKLGTILKFEEDHGIITFKNNRFLLIDAEAMGLLRREIIAMLGYDMARRLLTRYGYVCGYSDSLRLRQDYDWDSEEEWMMAGPMMHMLEGIVQVHPVELKYSRSEDTFNMRGEWLNSYEASQHIKHLGISNNPTCWTLAGYASGYASAFFDRQLVCIESKCVGKGDSACIWQITRPHQLGPEGKQALKDLEGFNLAGTINMLEEQIAARTAELSALNAASLVLAESLSLDELLSRVLPHVLRATGSSFGRVFLLEESGDRLELRVQSEPDASGLATEPALTQLYVALPAIDRSEWGRLKAGSLVTSHDFSHSLLIPELSSRHNWRSLVKVPLMVRGELAGIMELASKQVNWPVTLEEKRLLQSLGRQIGMALGNARLYEQEQQRARAWRGLVEISHKVAGSRDKEQVLASLVEYARELLDSEVSLVALLNEAEDALIMAATAGTRTHALNNLRLPHNQGFTATLIETNQPLITLNYAEDARLVNGPTPAVIAEGIVSMLAVPLMANDKVLGVLYVAQRSTHYYTEADADLLKALATQAAITVEKARLYEREIARIKEVERIKADFLAMVTHELRTPLTNIKGITTGLLQPDINWDASTQQTFLEAINEETDVLTKLVSDLLDMSRLEAGAWTIYLEECTFDEIVHDVQRKLVGVVQGRDIEIEAAEDLPRLRVDPTQITRVLVNLLTNALKYCKSGKVILSARPAEDKWLEVRVIDNGPGIPPSERARIFDKFYRSGQSNPAVAAAPGAGLGLAIVKGIIEAHGGRIWLEETPVSGGATFVFSLPLATE